MKYGYFTRFISRLREKAEFRPPLKDYFEVMYSLTLLDGVTYDTKPDRVYLKQLINKIQCEHKPCEIHMLSLFDIGVHVKDITSFLLNLPENAELYLFGDKVNISATISYLNEKYRSIYDLITCDDYIKVKIS